MVVSPEETMSLDRLSRFYLRVQARALIGPITDPAIQALDYICLGGVRAFFILLRF